ncbi:MAG: hypothetical protein Q9207_005421, partial [Kuettlingeria erythrocarpa]
MAIPQLQEKLYEELSTAYQQVYAPQIDKFLETQWFASRGLNYVMQDARLCDRICTLISRFSIEPDTEAFDRARPATWSLEANIIWSIMAVAKRVAGQNNAVEASAGVVDAAKRFEIIGNLLLGQYSHEEVPPKAETVNGSGLQAQLSQRGQEFWRLMHKFLTIRDDEASASHALDETLAGARGCLDVKENRDVIYSIALVRLHGGRENLENPDGGSVPNRDLGKAKTFLKEEAEGKGNSQSVRVIDNVQRKTQSPPIRGNRPVRPFPLTPPSFTPPPPPTLQSRHDPRLDSSHNSQLTFQLHQANTLPGSEAARSAYDSLCTLAELITPKSSNPADFLAECRSGAFDGARVVYRTFQSVSITGRIEGGVVEALAKAGVRFIAHNGAGYD